MQNDDVRNRFRGRTRRDFVGPMPAVRPAPQRPPEPPKQSIQEYQEPIPYYEPQQSTPEKPKKRRKKGKIFLIVFLILLVLAATGAGTYLKFFKKEKTVNQEVATETSQQTQQQTKQPQAQTKQTIRFVATGDMIAHGAILEQGKKSDGSYDFSPMLTNMKPYFDKADLKFCNQATPAGGASFGYTGYPEFNAPIEWPRALESVGCNVINIGTNHTNDKGQELVAATVKVWDDRPDILAVVGANRSKEEQSTIRMIRYNDINFAILSYSTYSNKPITNGYGINMYDSNYAAKEIAKARNEADFIIVSMRWGTEYSPSVDANQDRIAQELADAGADIIVGHGPHFLEPVKKLKGANGKETLVWFSLGNFLNAQIETEALIGGFAVMDIDIATKKIAAPKFMPVYMHYEWSPAQKAANDLLSRKNFQMYPLDQAALPMSKSQIGTTVEAQTKRVTELLNTYTPVTIIKSDQF